MEAKIISEGVELCPFLRNIHQPTVFSFSSFPAFHFPSLAKGGRGPIFEDGPNFDTAFRLFHGRDGIIPLSENKTLQEETSRSKSSQREILPDVNNLSDTLVSSHRNSCAIFHPLAASAATISLSQFGAFGPFGFDAFMGKGKAAGGKNSKGNSKKPSKRLKSDVHLNMELHEAMGSEWLLTGSCPIAKSYRAVSGVLPLVAKWLKPPPGMNYRCPPAIVAARAALARTALAKSLKPQPLPAKVLAIGLLGMAVNVPLGVWREHTKKFSPSWFVAVHASVPFVAMFRKAIHMPKYAMAFTIASAILGQVIGSRAERYRLGTSFTDAVNEYNVFPKQSSSADLSEANHNREIPSTKAHLQDEMQMESLHYQCAKDRLDTKSPAESISVAVGAF